MTYVVDRLPGGHVFVRTEDWRLSIELTPDGQATVTTRNLLTRAEHMIAVHIDALASILEAARAARAPDD